MFGGKMTEAQFISSIDCRFPWGNQRKMRLLASQALKISPNAVFMVYWEIGHPGHSARMSSSERFDMVGYLEERFVHPLGGLASWLVRQRIAGVKISVSRAKAAIRKVAKFPGCYNALNLACSSCDYDETETIDRLGDAVRKEWAELQP
jgi:hypothetical protein